MAVGQASLDGVDGVWAAADRAPQGSSRDVLRGAGGAPRPRSSWGWRALALPSDPCYGPAMRRPEQAGASVRARGDEEDVALVRSAARGDSEALARLYDRYASILLAVGFRILGHRREAEDLLHDVFIEVWRCAGDYDAARGSVRAWLLLRMRSRALDRHRAVVRSRVILSETGQLDGQAASHEDPSIAADRHVVRKAVEALPSEQRLVLELGYYEGLSSSEIAKRVDIPIGTVKSRVARGLEHLRSEILGGEGERKK